MGGLLFWGRKKLSVVLQTEAAECGLACLTMIAKYYGHKVDLNGLRQRFALSLKGATLQSIMNSAAQLSLGSRAIRAEIEALGNIQTPAILHWDLNHFVVLEKVRGKKVHILDPARGKRVMRIKDVSDHFTGVALELTPNAKFEKQSARKKVRLASLWSRLQGLKRAAFQLLVLSVLLQLAALIAPFYMQTVMDEVIVKYDTHLLFVLAAGFLGVSLIQTITTAMRGWAVLYYGSQMSFQMVSNVFSHLISLPIEYYEKRHVGDILSRIGSTAPIKSALTESVIAAILDGFMAIFAGVVIYLYSPLLAFVVAGAVAINLFITIGFYPILRRKQEEQIVASAKESSHMIESLRAAMAIKLFSAQNVRLSLWRNVFADTINTSISAGKYNLVMSTMQGLVSGVQSIVVVYFGAKLVLEDGSLFTVGMLFAFMSYRGHFTSSVNSLLSSFVQFRLLGLHLDRLADIVHAEPEAANIMLDEAGAEYLNGAIEFHNVSFRYAASDPWILRNVNIRIEPSDFVAIIGPSGGGKTTLLKLILGLYAPTEGEITIGGYALNDFNRIAWRSKLGVVMQDDQLLSGSIADNISFFDSPVDMERVYSASKLAQVHNDIMSMPMNYLSMIGDMGSALSGGQKQRVLLARSFYRDPQVLVLDEGTANIDEYTEKQIVNIIKTKQMTRIVVAHRPEFIKSAQKILVVQDGGVELKTSKDTSSIPSNKKPPFLSLS